MMVSESLKRAKALQCGATEPLPALLGLLCWFPISFLILQILDDPQIFFLSQNGDQLISSILMP